LSFADGWAAMHLEMPDRVPRTEYSAESHWDLIKAVTGIDVGVESPADVKTAAARAFMNAWNYDLVWSTLISRESLGQYRTRMGHAAYAAGGVDYDDNIGSAFEAPEEVLAFDPWHALGAIDRKAAVERFESHYKANCAANPECVNMTGVYITLVSGLIDLFGWDLLLTAAGMDPQAFGELTNRYSSWIQQFFDALADADVPVVMIHDDMVWTSGAIFRPGWYRRYVFPNYKRQFSPVIDSGKRVLFTSDGNYTEFIDDIADCGVHGFVMEPTTDMAYMAERYGRTHVFVGNADTRILLSGTRDQIRAEVERCMSIGKHCPGFFMAVGNHIPPNTPVENALYYNDVYEELSRR
jgi:hypothetical protein